MSRFDMAKYLNDPETIQWKVLARSKSDYVSAIKALRNSDTPTIGLKEAKDTVDAYIVEYKTRAGLNDDVTIELTRGESLRIRFDKDTERYTIERTSVTQRAIAKTQPELYAAIIELSQVYNGPYAGPAG